jgi:hypothetical protein
MSRVSAANTAVSSGPDGEEASLQSSLNAAWASSIGLGNFTGSSTLPKGVYYYLPGGMYSTTDYTEDAKAIAAALQRLQDEVRGWIGSMTALSWDEHALVQTQPISQTPVKATLTYVATPKPAIFYEPLPD